MSVAAEDALLQSCGSLKDIYRKPQLVTQPAVSQQTVKILGPCRAEAAHAEPQVVGHERWWGGHLGDGL